MIFEEFCTYSGDQAGNIEDVHLLWMLTYGLIILSSDPASVVPPDPLRAVLTTSPALQSKGIDQRYTFPEILGVQVYYGIHPSPNKMQ